MPIPITTTREALRVMALRTAAALTHLARHGYTDSDYDKLDELLTVTNELLSADYEGSADLPSAADRCWLPEAVVAYLS